MVSIQNMYGIHTLTSYITCTYQLLNIHMIFNISWFSDIVDNETKEKVVLVCLGVDCEYGHSGSTSPM